ncbi:predicted protein [Naegleria gruberi]|uniref:Predicted protein n=1 Tax=Naegleria gruberi TaxID=5762 RepID=D2VFJ9_NAEGR|nr:uncharacterized protein NAEGRDRAFT_67652 [Naegleria gruberi]EFC44482.1 predicted protein [Naegleria gruberi]|eukprot:XP_002677226.1 predicted protein [Naegleria gruberi strain NEG-M]
MGNTNSARKNHRSAAGNSRPESIAGSPEYSLFQQPLNSSNLSDAKNLTSPSKQHKQHKSISTGLLFGHNNHHSNNINGRDIILPVNEMFVVVSAPTTPSHNNNNNTKHNTNNNNTHISSQSKMIPHHHSHHHQSFASS